MESHPPYSDHFTKLVLTVVVAAGLCVAAAAQPSDVNGQHSSITVTCPAQVVAGKAAVISVTAANPAAEARIGTLAASIQGAGVIVQKEGAFTVIEPAQGQVTIFRAGSGSEWAVCGKQPATDTLVEMYEPAWPAAGAADDTRTLTFSVTFAAAGKATLLARASFATRTDNRIVVKENVPPEGSADQQGLPCNVYEISVTEEGAAPAPETTSEPAANPPTGVAGRWQGQWIQQTRIMGFLLSIDVSTDTGSVTAKGKVDSWAVTEHYEGTVNDRLVTLAGKSTTPAPDTPWSPNTLTLRLSEDNARLLGTWKNGTGATGTIRLTREP